MTSTRFLTTAAILASTSAASAQTDLYSNGSANPSAAALSTGVLSAAGAQAPQGFAWSEVQAISMFESNAVAGFSTHAYDGAGAYRFADDFTITGTRGWVLDHVSVYAFQPGAAGPPFSAANIRVWSGRPGDPGSVILFGDATTNRRITTQATNLYRIFASTVSPVTPADTTRLIWRTDIALTGLTLPPGTYWLDWQYTSANANEEAFSPPVTLAGVRTVTGWNARQLKPGGVWTSALDPGKPQAAVDTAQDLPFILNGVLAPCASDYDGSGEVNSNDVTAFLNQWFLDQANGTLLADYDGSLETNSNDVTLFLNQWFTDLAAGC